MPRHKRLLIVNESAGSIGSAVIEKLRNRLPRYHYVEYKRRMRVNELLATRAKVVVAGGDGAVESVASQLLHTPHALGIVAGGTYNNFAAGLGIPTDVDGSLEVVRTGSPKPVSIGMINGKPFFEAAIVGFFGEVLLAGEAAKGLEFGQLLQRLGTLVSQREFDFALSGDLEAEGRARTLIFANTQHTGTRIRVADGSPRDARLELSSGGANFRFRRLRLDTSPRLRCFADARPVTRTPATIEIAPAALRVLLKG